MGPTDPAQKELERDNLSRELGSLASSRTAEHRGPRLPFAQINEDFMHLQIVNNDLLRAVARSGTLDLTFVGKATSEIKKRAGRLKDNLVLPVPENDLKHSMPAVGVEAEQLRSSLLTLGRLIAGFAHNPIFKDTNIIDVQLSAKARRDLEAIIELSGQVKKNSERLNKAAQKSQKSFSPTPKADKNSGKR
jgi:hypothetical protein